MATLNWVLNSLLSIQPAEDNQEPAQSESTSVAVDARVSVYPMGDNHPLVSSFGAFENEPIWDELIRVMEEHRRTVAAKELLETGE